MRLGVYVVIFVILGSFVLGMECNSDTLVLSDGESYDFSTDSQTGWLNNDDILWNGSMLHVKGENITGMNYTFHDYGHIAPLSVDCINYSDLNQTSPIIPIINHTYVMTTLDDHLVQFYVNDSSSDLVITYLFMENSSCFNNCWNESVTMCDFDCWSCDTSSSCESSNKSCDWAFDRYRQEYECRDGCSNTSCWGCMDSLSCETNGCFWEGYHCTEDVFNYTDSCNPNNCFGCNSSNDCHSWNLTGNKCEWNHNLHRCEEVICSPWRCDLCGTSSDCLGTDFCLWENTYCTLDTECSSDNCWGCNETECDNKTGCGWNVIDSNNAECKQGCSNESCWSCEDDGELACTDAGCFWSVSEHCEEKWWPESYKCSPDNCSACKQEYCFSEYMQGNCMWDWDTLECVRPICGPDACHACNSNYTCGTNGCEWILDGGADSYGVPYGHCEYICNSENCWACTDAECGNNNTCRLFTDPYKNEARCEQGCSDNNCWACQSDTACNPNGNCLWVGDHCEKDLWSDINSSMCNPDNCSACSNENACWNWDLTAGMCRWDWKTNGCINQTLECGSESCHFCGDKTNCTQAGCMWNMDIFNGATGELGMCDYDPYVYIGDISCDDECFACANSYSCDGSDANCTWMNTSEEQYCEYSEIAEMKTCGPGKQCFACDNNTCSSYNCSWDESFDLCKPNATSEICFIPGDEDGDGLVDCKDPDCDNDPYCYFGGNKSGMDVECYQWDNTNESACEEYDSGNATGCFWHKPGYPRGNCNATIQDCLCDPLKMLDMNGDMMMDVPPVFIGKDSDDSISDWLDIARVGIKDDVKSFSIGIAVENITHVAYCSGLYNRTGYYTRYLDVFEGTGCTVADEHGLDQDGFDYKFVHLSNSTKKSINLAYKCKNNKWVQFSANVLGLKDGCELKSTVGEEWFGADIQVIKWNEIGGKKGNVRIFVTTADNASTPIDSSGPFNYYAGSIDSDTIDCVKESGLSACTKYDKDDGYYPFEDCIKKGDEDSDGKNSYYISMNNFSCVDPDCYMTPWCMDAYDEDNDTTPPLVKSSTLEASKDWAFVNWITDEPTNGTLFVFRNSRCKNGSIDFVDLGLVTSFDDYKPFHGVDVDNLDPGHVYGYRTSSCDKAGNCRISKCLNFTTLLSKPKVKTDYHPPKQLNDFDFEVCEGSTCSGINDTNSTVRNITLVFTSNESFTWSLTFEGASIIRNKTLNLSTALSVINNKDGDKNASANTTFIGITSTLWQNLVENFGVKSFVIELPEYFNNYSQVQLIKCEDFKSPSCMNISNTWQYDSGTVTELNDTSLKSYCSLISWNETENTTQWRCPATIGFSVFAVYMAEAVANDDDVEEPDQVVNNGNNGGGGSGVTSTLEGYFATMFSELISGKKVSIVVSKTGMPFTEIGFTPLVDLENVDLELRTIVNPSSLPDIPDTYNYVRVNIENMEDSEIDDATISFKVKKSWLTENGISWNNVNLFRYDEGWVELDTVHSKTSSSSEYYQSTTPGFSYFAIAKGTEITATDPLDPDRGEDTPETADTQVEQESDISDTQASDDVQTDDLDVGQTEVVSGGVSTLAIIVIAVLAMLVIIAGIFVFRKQA